jgi:transposase
MTNDEIAGREQRGMIIAATSKLRQKGKAWIVPSQSGNGHYTVVLDDAQPYCSCPDHETTGQPCKHIYATRIVYQRELFPDGSVQETKSVTITETRRTYPQNWRAYNAAQTSEKASFQTLLRALCEGIVEPPQAMGRPRIPLRDAIFSACFKVYSTFSGRRFMTDLREAHSEGFISRCPSYNSVFAVLESPETFDVLKALVLASAAPLKPIETKFACDSTGFSGCRFDRWFDEKWGTPIKTTKRAWVKCHIMCGVKTNVVAAVEIHGQHAHDSPQFEPLLVSTAERFKVEEVSADLAYSSHDNLISAALVGAAPMIPFKVNTTPAMGGLWAKCFHYFQMNREEFLKRYHLRSNVESTFSAVKRKFGDGVRSKLDVAMKNEVLAKLVCHNICCVIQEMHESGVDPTFWDKAQAV